MERVQSLMIQARTLVQRLGRCSADSAWAHKASGVRASLDKCLVRAESGSINIGRLEHLMQLGYELLQKAAESIPDPQDLRNPDAKA